MNQDENAHPEDDHPAKKEIKIHAEEVKGRHTTHWDLDYLPRDQVEDAFNGGQSDAEEEASGDEK